MATFSPSPPAPSGYADCVVSLRTSLALLDSSVSTLGGGVADFPRLVSVLKTVRHYELIPQPALAAAEASLRDEIGPFVAQLLDRAEALAGRQARRIETLKARSELYAGRLSSSTSSSSSHPAAAAAATTTPPKGKGRGKKGKRKTLDGAPGLRARAVRSRREALGYGVARLEMEVAQAERELRVRLERQQQQQA